MNYSLILFLGGGLAIFLMIILFCLIAKKPKIIGWSSFLITILFILLFIYSDYGSKLMHNIMEDRELFQDLVYGLFTILWVLFTSGKETIEGSGSDMPDTGRGNSSGGASTGPSAGASAGASAGPSAGPSRVQGRSFWEVIDASQEGGTSNSPVEDENPSLPEEGPSTLDKGKRKATEQEVLEQEERKRTRVSSPSPANEVYLKQEGSNRIKGSEESEEVNMEDIPELKENQDSPGSIYSIYSSNINTDDEEWVKEKKRERDASEEFLPRTRDEWDRARDRALNEEEEPNN